MGLAVPGAGALGAGAKNGKPNCAAAGAAHKTKTGRAAPAARKPIRIAVPTMEPRPDVPLSRMEAPEW